MSFSIGYIDSSSCNSNQNNSNNSNSNNSYNNQNSNSNNERNHQSNVHIVETHELTLRGNNNNNNTQYYSYVDDGNSSTIATQIDSNSDLLTTPNTSFMYTYDEDVELLDEDLDDDIDDDSLEDMYKYQNELDETDLQNIDQYFENGSMAGGSTQESVKIRELNFSNNSSNINIRRSISSTIEANNHYNNNNSKHSTNNNFVESIKENHTRYSQDLSSSTNIENFYQEQYPMSFQIFGNYKQQQEKQDKEQDNSNNNSSNNSNNNNPVNLFGGGGGGEVKQQQQQQLFLFNNISTNDNQSNPYELDLSESGLTDFPYIPSTSKYQIVDLSHNAISSIINNNESIKNLAKSLEQLILFNNMIDVLPSILSSLSNLVIMDLSHNNLKQIPQDSISGLRNLRELYLSGNSLSHFPPTSQLVNLRKLLLDNNQIDTIDSECIESLGKLQTLDLSINRITTIPETLSNLTSLKVFNLSKNNLTEIPTSIKYLTKLHSLSLDNNQISELNEKSWIKLTRLAKLTLANNRIKTLPFSINHLSSLIELNISQNHLESIPDSICYLSNLKKLDLNNNNIKELPQSIGNLSKLVDFQLYNNQISSFPQSFLKCRSIREIGVDGNPLPSFYHLGIKAIRYHIKNPDCDEIDQSLIFQEEETSVNSNQSSNPKRNFETNDFFNSPQKALYIDSNNNNINIHNSCSSNTSSIQYNYINTSNNNNETNNLLLNFSSMTLSTSTTLSSSISSSINSSSNFEFGLNQSANLNLSGNLLNLSNGSGVLDTSNGGEQISTPSRPMATSLTSSAGKKSLGNKLSPPRVRYEWEIDFKELEIGDLIGQGGFSKVYHGYWKSKEVAIKQIELQSYKSLEDFRREVGILSKLKSHENLLKYYGACTQNQYCYIITEYLPRGALYDILHREGTKGLVKIDLELLLTFATGVALGCYHLSTYDPPIYHTDLKSKNLLITNNLKIKICDFGLASCKRKDNRVDNGRLAYAFYAAPEILNCKPFTEKSDVFSFGTILWELITKQVPFHGMDPHYVKDFLKSGERLEIPQDCPEIFATLIKDCWNHCSDKRPTFLDIYYRLEKARQLL